jgi:hypothetical protein
MRTKHIKVSDDVGDGTLHCPSCGSINLHHFAVDVFNRDSEDCEKGLHTRLMQGDVNVDRSMKGNPSDRRDGITVWFHCELCPDVSILNIIQHKGTTFLSMGFKTPNMSLEDPIK